MRGPRLSLGVAGAACLLLLAPSAGASNSSPYADGAADAPAAAPDLTAVHVSNDDAGNVFFRISIPNRVALAYTDLVSLFVDADGKTGLSFPDRRCLGDRGRSRLRLRARHRHEPVELPGDRAAAGGDETAGMAAKSVPAAPAPLQAHATIEGVSSASELSVTSARASASSPGG